MMRVDEAFERLREANPVDSQSPNLTGLEMLERVRNEPNPVTPLRRPKDRRVVVLAAAAVLLIALLISPLIFDIFESGTDEPSELTTTGPNPALIDGDGFGELLGRVLPKGTYRSDALGVEFAADLDSIWYLDTYQQGAVVLDRTRTAVGFASFIAIIRPSGLSDLDQSRESVPVNGSWPLADLEGWLEQFGGEVGATDVTATTVGGLPATSFRVELPADTACGGDAQGGDGGECVPFVTNRQSVDIGFDTARWYQVWWVPIDGYEPVVVIAAEPDEAALAAVDSMALGWPSPHPLGGTNPWELGLEASVPAGPVVVPALGGARFDLVDDARIFQDDQAILIRHERANLDIFRTSSDLRGDALATSEAVVGVLEEAPVTIIELEPTTVAGTPTRVFELTDGPRAADTPLMTIFRRSNGENVVLYVPSTGTVWVLDAPGGPIVVAASVLGADQLPPGLTEMADLVVATLGFGDS